MQAYRTVKFAPDLLIARLKKFKHSESDFYKVRAANPSDAIEKAARFIYLNRTCFNGLYRVNGKGEFNVPFGRYKNPTICDAETINAASDALKNVKLVTAPFFETIDMATKGDFVYCDPPYLPRTETAGFTRYHKDDFRLGEHEQLFNSLDNAHKRGVKWMLSEGDSKFIRNLFKRYNVMPVAGHHTVAASADSRGKSRELLITNYKA